MIKKILLSSLLLISGVAFGQKEQLKETISSIIDGNDATVGVAVIYDSKDTLTINNNYQYPMMSVIKFHQALAVLDYMDKHDIPLETELFIRETDMKANTYSPLAKVHPKGTVNLSIKELLQYAVGKSDNNASNALFYYLLGTKATELYLQKLGLKNFSLIATEEELSLYFLNQYLDWSTPLDAAILMDKFVHNPLLSAPYKDFLMEALISTETGPNKLKSYLPKGTIIGHKTGSSYRNDDDLKPGDNDLAFIQLPNGKYLTIAVFIMNSRESDLANAAMMSEISKVVYDYYKNIKETKQKK